MAIREDLVSSAVTFLRDPSVANAPVDKRISFLQSKNLTKEEVDAALSRAGEGASAQVTPSNYSYAPQQSVRQPPPYGYTAYPQAWPQQPPEVPRRDWRDYFIMATVMGGLGYGAYQIATRYIVPLIKPPTPPQLEQDKASVDAAFNKAFELIEQLAKDTADIKAKEEERDVAISAAISDMNAAITELREASGRRDQDNRRVADDIRSLQAAIPKAVEANAENVDMRMRDLNTELKSLRTLLSSRVGAPQPPAPTPAPAHGSVPAVRKFPAPVNGNTNASSENVSSGVEDKPASPFNRFGSAQGGIPAWQMAAAKKNEAESKKDTSESGTVTESST